MSNASIPFLGRKNWCRNRHNLLWPYCSCSSFRVVEEQTLHWSKTRKLGISLSTDSGRNLLSHTQCTRRAWKEWERVSRRLSPLNRSCRIVQHSCLMRSKLDTQRLASTLPTTLSQKRIADSEPSFLAGWLLRRSIHHRKVLRLRPGNQVCISLSKLLGRHPKVICHRDSQEHPFECATQVRAWKLGCCCQSRLLLARLPPKLLLSLIHI